jgi:diguanylate cyclase (GGDEF)-like protein
LASVLGAQACALAERDPQRGWVWRFVGGTTPAVIAEDGALPGLAAAADEDASPELERALGLPVWAWGHRESQAAGQLLVVVRMPPSRFGAPQGEELRLMAEVLFGALARWRNLMELDSTRERLLRQSRSDALTGVANRREFDERKLNELRRARRLQQPLSVMMVDVDHFKRFNDHYGHAAGDDCLTRVAQTLQGLFLRPFDCVARLGGEEFAVLLPDTSDETVQRQAQRVLAAIAGLNIVHAGSPAGQLSVSLGTATLSLHDASPAEAAFDRLLRAADKALYRAKAEGRGRAAHEPAA